MNAHTLVDDSTSDTLRRPTTVLTERGSIVATVSRACAVLANLPADERQIVALLLADALADAGLTIV